MTMNDVVTKQQRNSEAGFLNSHFLKLPRVSRTECIEKRSYFSIADVLLILRPDCGAGDGHVAGIERELTRFFFNVHQLEDGVDAAVKVIPGCRSTLLTAGEHDEEQESNGKGTCPV